MKIICIISALLGSMILSVSAQEPVPLEVWRVNKSNPFRGVYNRFCYLPNFRNGEGKNAIVIRKRSWDDKVDRMETWYNRDEADTLNQFTWPFGFCPYATPDMNGDGRRDFFNGSTLYLGTERDEPDTSKPYTYPANANGFNKLNDDNCDDLYYHGGSPYLIHFRFGNATAGKYQSVSVISKNATADTQSYEQLKAIYKNKQGKWRLLTHSKGWTKGMYKDVWLPKKSYLRLYALDFVTIHNDSTAVSSQLIDEYQDPKWLEYVPDFNDKEPIRWLPVNDAGLLYNSEHFPKILYYASFNTVPDKVTQKYNSYATIIDLTEDRILVTQTQIMAKVLNGKILSHNVNGDKREDIAIINKNKRVEILAVQDDGVPIDRSYVDIKDYPVGAIWSGIESINDINGDEIPDLAFLLLDEEFGNTLIIAKGKKITNSLTENNNLIISQPYPLPSNHTLAIPVNITIPKSCTLSLYSQGGKLIHTIFSGELFTGNTIIEFNTSDIVSGTYILRLSDGRDSTDRLIIINH